MCWSDERQTRLVQQSQNEPNAPPPPMAALTQIDARKFPVPLRVLAVASHHRSIPSVASYRAALDVA